MIMAVLFGRQWQQAMAAGKGSRQVAASWETLSSHRYRGPNASSGDKNKSFRASAHAQLEFDSDDSAASGQVNMVITTALAYEELAEQRVGHSIWLLDSACTEHVILVKLSRWFIAVQSCYPSYLSTPSSHGHVSLTILKSSTISYHLLVPSEHLQEPTLRCVYAQ